MAEIRVACISCSFLERSCVHGHTVSLHLRLLNVAALGDTASLGTVLFAVAGAAFLESIVDTVADTAICNSILMLHMTIAVLDC
jgi:hypothetical protein